MTGMKYTKHTLVAFKLYDRTNRPRAVRIHGLPESEPIIAVGEIKEVLNNSYLIQVIPNSDPVTRRYSDTLCNRGEASIIEVIKKDL